MKTVRRPPYPKWSPGYFPCSSLTPPSAFLKPSFGGFGLRLIDAGLSNSEICDKLYISLNTLRSHTRGLYRKLDVHSRTQATAIARQHGLLAT